jgi:hypothetical protein
MENGRGVLDYVQVLMERKATTMIDKATSTKLQQDEEMAYFRADLCLSSPESYSLEEKKQICNDMAATSMAQLAAIREDFQSYPPEIQERLLGMLSMSGIESPQWWYDASSVKRTCPLARS